LFATADATAKVFSAVRELTAHNDEAAAQPNVGLLGVNPKWLGDQNGANDQLGPLTISGLLPRDSGAHTAGDSQISY
jgi:hypothetical protein